ncbi:gibberellin 20 oxidase [Tanacetum coccineum]
MDCQKTPLVFDSLILQHETNIPQQFIWPDQEKPSLQKAKELVVPLVDLGGFLSGQPSSAKEAQRSVEEPMDLFFELPLSDKQRAQRKLGESCGYASSFTGRFSSKLPWKETLSFQFSGEKSSSNMVNDYFENTMGKDLRRLVTSLGIMELLGMSLGVHRAHFKEFFEQHDSIMRLNYYPRCQKPDLTLGTGPHCDPTSLTILHQDSVGGLEVYTRE